jgi:hypothetical protein
VLTKYNEENIDEDIIVIKQLIKVLDEEKAIENNPLLQIEYENKSRELDLYLLYLRKVTIL